MEGWQKRVIHERTDLRSKLSSLYSFLSDQIKELTIGEDELRLLFLQRDSMERYLEVLDRRIENFKKTVPPWDID